MVTNPYVQQRGTQRSHFNHATPIRVHLIELRHESRLEICADFHNFVFGEPAHLAVPSIGYRAAKVLGEPPSILRNRMQKPGIKFLSRLVATGRTPLGIPFVS
jgi:hypothetical protein